MPHMKLARRAAQLSLVTVVTLTSGLSLAAGTGPIRLLGVSGEGNAVLIESAEPAAYVVKRPDSLTLLVELRNVSVANAANLVARRDPIAGVVARAGERVRRPGAGARARHARPAHRIRRAQRAQPDSARADRCGQPRAAGAVQRDAPIPAPTPKPAPAPQAPLAETPEATILDRVLASAAAGATTVTLSGNGRLTPIDVSESLDRPRRLVLDFPNVASKALAQTAVAGSLVKQVRVANTREPLFTRVVMDVAEGATYHVERAGADGRDLAVIFEPPQSAGTIMLASPRTGNTRVAAEPDIPLHEAIANAASITPKEVVPADPIAAPTPSPAPLKALPPPAAAAPSAAPPVAAAAAAAAPRRRRPRRCGNSPSRRRPPRRRHSSSRALPRRSTWGTRSPWTSPAPISDRCCATSTRSAG